MVAAPDDRGARVAERAATALSERRLPLAAVVVNRVHPLEPGAEYESVREAVAPLAGADSAWVAENFMAHQRVGAGEARRIERLRRLAPAAAAFATVPDLAGDVHDLDALSELAEILCAARAGSAKALRAV